METLYRNKIVLEIAWHLKAISIMKLNISFDLLKKSKTVVTL